MKSIFAFVAVATSASVTAQDGEVAKFAATSSKVANAIAGGKAASVRDLLPEISDAEFAVIEQLESCEGELSKNATRNFVPFVWTCPTPIAGEFASFITSMRYTNEGEMFALEMNPIFNEIALARPASDDKVRKPREITRSFAQAVRRREDVTLGGLIPVAPFQIAQLDAIQTNRFHYSETRGELQQPILFYGAGLDKGAARQVSVHFDANGQPLGISIMLANVRTTTTISTVSR